MRQHEQQQASTNRVEHLLVCFGDVSRSKTQGETLTPTAHTHHTLITDAAGWHSCCRSFGLQPHEVGHPSDRVVLRGKVKRAAPPLALLILFVFFVADVKYTICIAS